MYSCFMFTYQYYVWNHPESVSRQHRQVSLFPGNTDKWVRFQVTQTSKAINYQELHFTESWPLLASVQSSMFTVCVTPSPEETQGGCAIHYRGN